MSLVLLTVPGYISRSVAGSYDNEGIAIFALQFTYFLWVGIDLYFYEEFDGSKQMQFEFLEVNDGEIISLVRVVFIIFM